MEQEPKEGERLVGRALGAAGLSTEINDPESGALRPSLTFADVYSTIDRGGVFTPMTFMRYLKEIDQTVIYPERSPVLSRKLLVESEEPVYDAEDVEIEIPANQEKNAQTYKDKQREILKIFERLSIDRAALEELVGLEPKTAEYITASARFHRTVQKLLERSASGQEGAE